MAQNLVPNSSFEEYKELKCDLYNTLAPPFPYENPKVWFQSILKDWILPINAPSQIYSVKLPDSCLANPSKFNRGHPKDGFNMVGLDLLVAYNQNTNGRTYVQVRLKEKLKEQSTYSTGGYYSLANSYGSYASNNLGLYFSEDAIGSDTTLMLRYDPQINQREVNSDPLVWKKFGGCFTAQGNETYLTIGNFYDDNNTKAVQFVKGDTRGTDFASYFIDSVYVQKVKEPFIPNVITPNGDCCNEKFVLKDVDATEWSVTILNRWGQSVHQSESYKNNFNGSELSAGVYFYHVQHRECKNLIYKGSLTIIH
ncbi:MAG: gliding motility-associated C-terminal domain-containing protein [Flammeovirgaceae bacterium]